MKGAVLLDDCSTVDAHNLSIRECLANDAQGFGVKVRLGVGGHEDSAIDDEVVGIGSRKAILRLAGRTCEHTVVIDGMGQWQEQQAVGFAVESAQGLQFLLHEGEVGVLVVASCI